MRQVGLPSDERQDYQPAVSTLADRRRPTLHWTNLSPLLMEKRVELGSEEKQYNGLLRPTCLQDLRWRIGASTSVERACLSFRCGGVWLLLKRHARDDIAVAMMSGRMAVRKLTQTFAVVAMFE